MIDRLWVCETHARNRVILLARAPRVKGIFNPNLPIRNEPDLHSISLVSLDDMFFFICLYFCLKKYLRKTMIRFVFLCAITHLANC